MTICYFHSLHRGHPVSFLHSISNIRYFKPAMPVVVLSCGMVNPSRRCCHVYGLTSQEVNQMKESQEFVIITYSFEEKKTYVSSFPIEVLNFLEQRLQYQVVATGCCHVPDAAPRQNPLSFGDNNVIHQWTLAKLGQQGDKRNQQEGK